MSQPVFEYICANCKNTTRQNSPPPKACPHCKAEVVGPASIKLLHGWAFAARPVFITSCPACGKN